MFLHSHSRFYNLIRTRLGHHSDAIAEFLQPPPDRPDLYLRWAWCFEPWSPQTKKNVARTLDLLRRIARLCRQRGVKLMLAAVPHYLQFNRIGHGHGPSWSRRPHHVIAEVAAEQGVPFLNSVKALEPLIQGTPQSTYYYRGDPHFNPKGYGIWAAAHLRFLRDKKNRLLPVSKQAR